MTINEIAKCLLTSTLTLHDLQKSGKLTREIVLMGLGAARTYLGAIARGEVVDDAEYERRISLCQVCPDRTQGEHGESYCGPKAQPTDRTCGCLIEAKARCAGESCPQMKWCHLNHQTV